MALEDRAGREERVSSDGVWPAARTRYLPIAERGLIGDLQRHGSSVPDGRARTVCGRGAGPTLAVATQD